MRGPVSYSRYWWWLLLLPLALMGWIWCELDKEGMALDRKAVDAQRTARRQVPKESNERWLERKSRGVGVLTWEEHARKVARKGIEQEAIRAAAESCPMTHGQYRKARETEEEARRRAYNRQVDRAYLRRGLYPPRG